MLGLSLPRLLRAEKSRHPSPGGRAPGRAKSCILLWLGGGPSQPDMWDMKPDAPAEVRVRREFGRSPKVNAWAGRDHWPRCYSVLLAGGVRARHIYGKSVRIGEDPTDDPVTPHDVVATMYSLLGIPPETELPDQLGRPVRVGGPGKVIKGVMA
jgi:hypothetical protein